MTPRSQDFSPMVFSPALRRRLLRGMSCAAGGTAVLGLGQVAKLRWQYECPGRGKLSG